MRGAFFWSGLCFCFSGVPRKSAQFHSRACAARHAGPKGKLLGSLQFGMVAGLLVENWMLLIPSLNPQWKALLRATCLFLLAVVGKVQLVRRQRGGEKEVLMRSFKFLFVAVCSASGFGWVAMLSCPRCRVSGFPTRKSIFAVVVICSGRGVRNPTSWCCERRWRRSKMISSASRQNAEGLESACWSKAVWNRLERSAHGMGFEVQMQGECNCGCSPALSLPRGDGAPNRQCAPLHGDDAAGAGPGSSYALSSSQSSGVTFVEGRGLQAIQRYVA